MTRRAALLLLASLLVPADASASVPAFHPSRLRHLGRARQVIVVTSPSWGSSYATLRAYRRDADGHWQLHFGPWRARLGYAGMSLARQRNQDDGTTPAGTFRLLWGFGSLVDPGTRLALYTRFDQDDWWPIDPRDPATYNVFQRSRSKQARWRREKAERLAHWGDDEYRYGVVLDFNVPDQVRWSSRLRQHVTDEPADTARGGAIFLHVNGSGPTAGCVSVSLDRMRKLLLWLDAAQRPRIVIGPTSVIDEM
ncbi:MAG TPA: L,D-transpeptidase family protein [Nocardioidaceae bacterium]|nr:L,D-transpeptidase family protein [Nocardioidaceae bacterium]